MPSSFQTYYLGYVTFKLNHIHLVRYLEKTDHKDMGFIHVQRLKSPVVCNVLNGVFLFYLGLIPLYGYLTEHIDSVCFLSLVYLGINIFLK